MPVASVKSGAIFEKRLIEAYIAQHGKDPVSGEELGAADLIDLKCMAFPDEGFPLRLLMTPSLDYCSAATAYLHFDPSATGSLPERVGRPRSRDARAPSADDAGAAGAVDGAVPVRRGHTGDYEIDQGERRGSRRTEPGDGGCRRGVSGGGNRADGVGRPAASAGDPGTGGGSQG